MSKKLSEVDVSADNEEFWTKIKSLLDEGGADNEDLAALLVGEHLRFYGREWSCPKNSIAILSRMHPIVRRLHSRENHDATMQRLSLLKAKLFPKPPEET